MTDELPRGSALLPSVIGRLAGPLVVSKPSRELLMEYDTSTLLADGGMVADMVL